MEENKLERRYRIGIVSHHEVVNHTGHPPNPESFIKALKAALPEGTAMLNQRDDMNTASLRILLNNPEWPEIGHGKDIKEFCIKLGEPKPESSIIRLAH